MAYNTRRNNEGISSVGARRNPPLSHNFVPRGQLGPNNRPNRPMGQPQGQGSNGNFRQPQQRMGGPQQFQMKAQQQGSPPQQKQQPQPQPQQPPPPQISDPLPKPEAIQSNEQTEKKPFWINKTGKISKKERNRRKNVRLSKMLQPKNAVMILNELVKSATYTVNDNLQPSPMKSYTAAVVVDGVTHEGFGRSKMDAKSMAAENALKHIIKNRQFTALKQEPETEDKMEIGEDGQPSLPWQHIASFALYKLLNSWGEDVNPNEVKAPGPVQNKPAKALPENAVHMNPLMLLNQMLPQAQFEEMSRAGNPPNVIFTIKCTVDEQSFIGTGPNKKSAKKMVAFQVCTTILGMQYPPEVYVAN